MDQVVLVELLQDACRAPSGDNVQPWRFRWDGLYLFVYNIPGVHNPHLDFEERGAYIAHGALIENLCTAAPHYGYEASFDLFPDKNKPDLVAIFSFSPCEPRDEVLYPMIRARATNRHPYQTSSLTGTERQLLVESVADISSVELHLVSDRGAIAGLARAASRAEIVILENEGASAHFFSGMVWTQKEERKRREGFFVKTMEFNPAQYFTFWLASKPRFMRWLRKLGLPRFVADQDAKLYATGSAMGGVFLRDDSARSYIKAGRALERIWLTATKEGLAFQPLIGMNFIAYRVETGRGVLAETHTKEMHNALAQAKNILGDTRNILAFIFRVGYAPKPTARTSRRDPIIEFV